VAPFVWFDLLTSKTAETGTFYRELLGWPLGPVPSGSGYEKWFLADWGPWAGIKAIDATQGSWLPFAQVGDPRRHATTPPALAAPRKETSSPAQRANTSSWRILAAHASRCSCQARSDQQPDRA
jgi:hypothetical protein